MTSWFSGAVCSGTIERARSAAHFRRGSGGKLCEGEEAAGGKGCGGRDAAGKTRSPRLPRCVVPPTALSGESGVCCVLCCFPLLFAQFSPRDAACARPRTIY